MMMGVTFQANIDTRSQNSGCKSGFYGNDVACILPYSEQPWPPPPPDPSFTGATGEPGQRAAEAAEPDPEQKALLWLQLIRFGEEGSGAERKKSPGVITGTPRSCGGSG